MSFLKASDLDLNINREHLVPPYLKKNELDIREEVKKSL